MFGYRTWNGIDTTREVFVGGRFGVTSYECSDDAEWHGDVYPEGDCDEDDWTKENDDYLWVLLWVVHRLVVPHHSYCLSPPP